jgi:predicted nucleic acid-binding protein
VGLILDSTVVILAERRGESAEAFLRRAIQSTFDQEVALSAVGLTELVHGIYRADSPERLTRRKRFLDDLCAGMNIYPYTEDKAFLADRIDGEQQAKGQRSLSRIC